MRVAASLILCACCAVRCELEVSERIPSNQYLGTGADESRYCQRCEPSNATAQGSTEASKTSCHDPKENPRTECSCCHTWRHADYSNKPCPTTETANLLFVVFYSYQQESPSSDFSLNCDGKSVAQDIVTSVSS